MGIMGGSVGSIYLKVVLETESECMINWRIIQMEFHNNFNSL